MKKYSIGKFAEEIGVTIESVRNWDRTGKLKPAFRNPYGHCMDRDVNASINLANYIV